MKPSEMMAMRDYSRDDIVAFLTLAGCGEVHVGRVARLNPEGVRRFQLVRGFRNARTIKSRIYNVDAMTVRRFIASVGRDAYRRLPREAFIRDGHRKVIAGSYIDDHFVFRA